jgi:adenine phosphoribosyltransferase
LILNEYIKEIIENVKKREEKIKAEQKKKQEDYIRQQQEQQIAKQEQNIASLNSNTNGNPSAEELINESDDVSLNPDYFQNEQPVTNQQMQPVQSESVQQAYPEQLSKPTQPVQNQPLPESRVFQQNTEPVKQTVYAQPNQPQPTPQPVHNEPQTNMMNPQPEQNNPNPGGFDFDSYIRRVPDFPKPGILFYDVTTLIKDKEAFNSAVQEFASRYRAMDVDAIVGVESRGFIFGAALAYELGIGFIPARKPGKLPGGTVRAEYQLEYGTDAIELHKDAITQGQKILIVDDLIATGGTIKATASLVEHLGGKVVELAFLVDLENLHGDIGYPYYTLLKYNVDE